MQMAMIFGVSGRESDVGRSVSEADHDKYRRLSREAFNEYARSMSIDEEYRTVCVEALGTMYTDSPCEPHASTTTLVRRIFERTHDLDLFRCKTKAELSPKLAKLTGELGASAATDLMKYAIKMIKQTGDRLVWTPYPDIARNGSYLDKKFRCCSKSVDECILAISSAVSEEEKDLESLKPGPKVDGELENHRFIETQFIKMYEAQKTKWLLTNWTELAVKDQRREVMRAARGLVTAYGKEKGMKEDDINDYIGDAPCKHLAILVKSRLILC